MSDDDDDWRGSLEDFGSWRFVLTAMIHRHDPQVMIVSFLILWLFLFSFGGETDFFPKEKVW